MGGADRAIFLLKYGRGFRLKLAVVTLALQSVAGLASAAVGDPELIGEYQTVRTEVGTPLLDEFDLSFGSALAFSNGRLAVGAADEYVDAAEDVAGAVYVYEPGTGGVLHQVARLNEPTPDRNRRFGRGVGMDGDWLAVSSPGIVYVYNRAASGVWSLAQTITRTDGAVGGPVAMKGNFLVLAGNKTQQGSTVSAVHLYKLVNGNWVPRTSITAPAGASGFGTSVAVVKDRIVVGAPSSNASAGLAYVFEPDANNSWQVVATLDSSSTARRNFGRSVSLDGDRCIVGASSSAEIFERDASNNWARLTTLLSSATEADDFGKSVAIKANRVIVGAPKTSGMDARGIVNANHGAAYVFKQNAVGEWPQVSRVGALDGGTRPAELGAAVAISGSQFAAGAPRGDTSQYPAYYWGRVVVFDGGSGGRDFGDAPAPYPTLKADNGARHGAGNLWLGSTTPDKESDGQPDPDALGDDYDGMPDEDGIVFPEGDLVPGALNRIQAYVSGAPGVLDVWIDYNRDGDWDDEGEYVLKHRNVQPGRTNFRLSAIPAGYSLGKTFVRARLSTAGSNKPTGAAEDGEVEDMAVNISPAVVSLAYNTVSVQEGQSSGATIRLNRVLDVPLTVQYSTEDGTAVAPGDYVATSGSFVIPAGTDAIAAPVQVQVNADGISEPDETFKLKLTSVSGGAAVLQDSTLTITIRAN